MISQEVYFKNFFNELHCRETSTKVKSVRKSHAQSGKFMGSRAPFGYKKDPQNKHRLIIDEPAALIVRRIFDMRCQGHGYRTIVTRLNDEGVTPPGEYLFAGEDNPMRGNGLWTNTTVMRLTKNEAYIGHMVQFKTGNLSFKNRKPVSKPEDEWVRVENTHEPIVERAVWDMAQELASSKRKPRQMSDGGRNMYVGLLKCAECVCLSIKKCSI